jgi:hypothetical protein
MGYKAVLVTAILAGAYAQVLSAPAQQAPPTPVQILRTFRTIYIRASTWLSKSEMLGGELQKKREFDEWGLAILNDSGADVIITVDHQPGWFYYTYSMVHQATGTVVATGTVSAWDGKQACGKIAGEIIKCIKRARSAEAR